MAIDSIDSRCFWIDDNTYCVFDHIVCTMDKAHAVFFIRGDVDASWHRPLALGTEKAVYIEDCQMNYHTTNYESMTDCENGGRFVIRNCKIINSQPGMHDNQVGIRL